MPLDKGRYIVDACAGQAQQVPTYDLQFLFRGPPPQLTLDLVLPKDPRKDQASDKGDKRLKAIAGRLLENSLRPRRSRSGTRHAPRAISGLQTVRCTRSTDGRPLRMSLALAARNRCEVGWRQAINVNTGLPVTLAPWVRCDVAMTAAPLDLIYFCRCHLAASDLKLLTPASPTLSAVAECAISAC